MSNKTSEIKKDSANPKPDNPTLYGLSKVRLTIAIPVLTGVLVLFFGVLLLRIVEITLGNTQIPEQTIDTIMIFPKLAIVGCTAIAMIAGYLLSHVIVKPIRQITKTVENVATGNLDTTEQIPSHIEIDVLQTSFNRMVNSLRSYVHERNEYIIESLAGALLTLDSTGNITNINKSAETILGMTQEGFHGKSIFDIFPDSPENHRILEMFHNSLQQKITYSSEEVTLTTHDNKKIPIGISISLLKDKNNQLMGIVATFKDLSKIKIIQQQLQRSDRLAAIGSLATGLAHEIRNPLGSIRGLAQMLAEDMKPEDPKFRYAKVIMKEIDRLNHVVQELLTFSQSSSSGMGYDDVNIALRDALFIAKQNPKTNANLEIIETYDTQLPKIKIEKEKLMQAFLNIIQNAIEAASDESNESGKVEIKSILSDARSEYPVPNLGFALIEIANTGKPIPQDYIEHIFDPFFTTKESGTGLGLAISHQIIAAHSGLIEVSSGPNEMTIFHIYLPIIKEREVAPIVASQNSNCR